MGGQSQIGARLGSIDIALMENGAYDSGWPMVHLGSGKNRGVRSPRVALQARFVLDARAP
jgi:hypothetical protein